MSFSDPSAVLEHVQIRPGSTVVDIGAGLGTYSILAAERVGDDGSVYAVEVQLDHVDTLKVLTNKEEIGNLHVLWGDAELPEGTKLKDQIADTVILTNVLFTIEDKNGLIEEIKRILKPGGQILVVDWSDSFGGIGPQPQNIVSEKITRDLFTQSDFKLEEKIPAGSHHYGMILSKNK